jgi:nucleotide-binding universal stress UspA family protein
MSANKILFPTDFSTAAEAGLAEAEVLAKARGASLLILHVQEPMMAYDGALYYGPVEPTTELLDRMLHDVVPGDKSIRYEHRLTMGDPATEIVRVANDENVSLIVMGTHGRSGFPRLLLGSVAELVIRHANCPVLTYKAPKLAAKKPVKVAG